MGAFDRTIALLGEQNFNALQACHVFVVGLGGVGGMAAEVLARTGVGALTVMDAEVYESTNLNRQIFCDTTTLGMNKAFAAKNRLSAVCPSCNVTARAEFFNDTTDIDLTKFDYVCDAIDDIEAKTLLVCECKNAGVPIICALGAGNRTSCDFKVTDIYKTSDDPLARKFRRYLRSVGIESLEVVCATTPPSIVRGTPASIAAPPLVMGAMLANRIIQKICNISE